MMVRNLGFKGRGPGMGFSEPLHLWNYMKNPGYHVPFGGVGERDSGCQFLKSIHFLRAEESLKPWSAYTSVMIPGPRPLLTLGTWAGVLSQQEAGWGPEATQRVTPEKQDTWGMGFVILSWFWDLAALMSLLFFKINKDKPLHSCAIQV